MSISRVVTAVTALGALVVLQACVVHGEPMHEAGPRSNSQGVTIPPGHMPPPGQCRIWYPDQPPGQQPPPGDCRQLMHRLPPGAVFLRG